MYHNTISAMQNVVQDPSLNYFRVLHAVPDAPSVDVYANDKLVVKNISYRNYTPYIPLAPGNYIISLYVSGSKYSPILTNMLSVTQNDILTIAIAGTLSTIGFLSIIDDNIPSDPRRAVLRFAHLSPNTPAVDIALSDGTILFRNVSFKQLTRYLSVHPSNYTLQVQVAGTTTVILTIPNIELVPNKFYSVYAIGLLDSNPQLEYLLTLDGFK